ncbi:hypothetical protein CANARDRAFT_7824 [[Candida] arabinofermentans NRRL YB-2248]|uniref:tRNA-5-taurinomethyluridine 2-sulfurtransferase n=1 Tax=[Candida] arabinofermentans NRRL YB-2248 TaxID=983967 RepID=A0A1E4T081_9ASCO|nr:hypothetical protein CANARDRAFT_7824 [[Candida] arabinofermentans NRRL YB-2248]
MHRSIKTTSNTFASLKGFGRRLYSTPTTTSSQFLKFNESPTYSQPEPKPDDQIIISMSSGVDSSVTALMYSKLYPNVKGIFMANWSPDSIGGAKKCTVEKDWEEVQATCQQLGIPCERVNFEKEYWSSVFEPMLEMYKKGLTPNPDVGCNKYVKFGKMIEHLSEELKGQGDWWLATGHYAKVMKHQPTGEHHLLRSDFMPKDQSYYLSQVPENVLSRILMPMGHYTKPQIREIAKKNNLLTKDKPDSQGLCFVSQIGKFKDFLGEFLEANPGNIVTEDGKIWGQHTGLWHGTIGQKSGISMPQGDPKYKGVWFISGKNRHRNELVISKKSDYNAFHKDTVYVTDWSWVNKSLDFNDSLCTRVNELTIQFRSLQEPVSLKKLTVDVDGEGEVIEFELSEKTFGIAPGQFLVLYHRDRVLGCGVITNMKNSSESVA